eukprot:TRINITY_DN528_c0_g1_i1.p1 TRINITY_DN528_c0_g1~~TRINITY_DN528_c0_g1_i1.p1  ORF type:complete len:343 (-),score=43.70 TRINITY_DN528_c0_g1_i1:85-1113(-)
MCGSGNSPVKKCFREGTCPNVQYHGILGTGSFGTVFLARDLLSKEFLAVKRIAVMPACHRFSQEVYLEYSVLKGIIHPNIVRNFGFEMQTNFAYIFMEYAAAKTVSHLMAFFGKLPESVVQLVIQQILRALICLHSQNPPIVHRDVKPSNMLIAADGTVKLGDCGSCRPLDPEQAAVTGRRRAAAGTPRYMAHESFRGRAVPTTDIWAVGCSVTELLSGRAPWSNLELDSAQLAFFIPKHPEDRPQPPRDLSPRVLSLLARCFQSDPEDRASAEELMGDEFFVCEASSGEDSAKGYMAAWLEHSASTKFMQAAEVEATRTSIFTEDDFPSANTLDSLSFRSW